MAKREIRTHVRVLQVIMVGQAENCHDEHSLIVNAFLPCLFTSLNAFEIIGKVGSNLGH